MTGSGTPTRVDPFVGPLWHHLVPLAGPGSAHSTELVRANGIHVWDAEGRRYIDGTSTMGAVMVGHGRAELADAAHAQIMKAQFIALTTGWTNRPATALAERLLDTAGQVGGAVWLQNSGSEAVEAAIRIALNYHLNTGSGDRRIILACESGYHGITLGAAAATGSPDLEHFTEDAGRSFTRLPATPGDTVSSETFIAALESTIADVGADRIAALIAEPIPTPPPGGVRVPPQDHWRRVRDILSANGILLIFDEVFDGFGRTGRLLAQHHYGVQGDLTTLSKGITSGYVPLSAVVVSEAVAREFASSGPRVLKHGGTYSGHPVSCAVALRNLDLIQEEDLVSNAADRGFELMTTLERIADTTGVVARPAGTGLLYSLPVTAEEPDAIGHSIRAHCRDNGLLISYTRGFIYLFPPLIVTTEDVVEIAGIVEAALQAVARGYRC